MYSTLKRVIDIFFSLSFILVFSWLYIITSIAIFLGDGGSPIYVQRRVGKQRKEFDFIKFRSMVKNADQILFSNPELYKQARSGAHKIKNDPRITSIGKFIRKYSIDELPQFINVLKGDMSFVGPRAYRPDELAKFEREYPEVKKSLDTVFEVKPGITGLWQVSGRSAIHFLKRVEMDAEYAKRKSIVEDFAIILKTPMVVLKGEGAE